MLVAFALLAATGCAGRAERLARERAPTLALGETVEGSIHCSQGRCSQWYRLVMERPQRVQIEADAPADPRLPDFGLTLLNAHLVIVGDERVERARPRRITEQLESGLYYVHVWGLGRNQDRVSYRLEAKARSSRAARRPARRAPVPAAKPAPKPVPTLASEILEVERAGGEPVAVLLELGSAGGVSSGMRGRLMNGDREIGAIEIVDVYPEGSRARIVEGLSAPIDAETRAEIAPRP